MNILPKKRWHVRTKDNIARVRKDEAEALAEERKRQDKLELAESEARVNLLRKRSGLPEKQHLDEKSDNLQDKEESSKSRHVNLFADYKAHVKTINKDFEREKKDEQEKYEKKIGYLTYLGQDTNEALRLKSWYEVAPKHFGVESERGEINEKDLRTKHNHDPLTLINALLPHDAKPIIKTNSTNRKTSSSPQITIAKTEYCYKPSKKDKKERKKHKKEKHKKHSKERKRKKEKSAVDEQTQRRLKLEQLRKERLRREAAEKKRQDILLEPKVSKKAVEVNCATPKVVQKYNSQFNPELAKQNMI